MVVWWSKVNAFAAQGNSRMRRKIIRATHKAGLPTPHSGYPHGWPQGKSWRVMSLQKLDAWLKCITSTGQEEWEDNGSLMMCPDCDLRNLMRSLPETSRVISTLCSIIAPKGSPEPTSRAYREILPGCGLTEQSCMRVYLRTGMLGYILWKRLISIYLMRFLEGNNK